MTKAVYLLMVAGLISSSGLVNAAVSKTYQVTGPVLDVTEKVITIQKGKERWDIARDASTELKGSPKKGDKVIVEYRMTASNIEVKADQNAGHGKGKKP